MQDQFKWEKRASPSHQESIVSQNSLILSQRCFSRDARQHHNMKFVIFLSILLLAMSMASASGCICTTEYKPVCATNGITYCNLCRMRCNGAKLLYPGTCEGCV
ncbi:unnamed protein product [Parnassius apollo]|uniref:(apollo) hypothetical protein n=1 Tax=Parnassius apollo TaxID=110799 RepID=A0A8S3WD07_PARAO|nr:unnamed protein product [Parnassius apollo]